MLKLSLIIPVYNEERHIKACLDAVAVQTVMPDEVIVVDNNCSDRTLEIAKKYDFVKIIHEPKQGRGYARGAGLDYASGDILARIDADSRINPNWVEVVHGRFGEDTQLAGVTGIANTAIIPYTNRIKSKLASRSYYWFAHAGFRTVTMWGANMAIRGDYWREVRKFVSVDDSIVHEDQDLSLWIAAMGGKIVQDNSLVMTTNGQTYRYLPKLIHYARLYESTKKLHTQNGNLSRPRLHKLTFRSTILGRVYALLFGIYIFIFSIILFPIDLFIYTRDNKSSWLD